MAPGYIVRRYDTAQDVVSVTASMLSSAAVLRLECGVNGGDYGLSAGHCLGGSWGGGGEAWRRTERGVGVGGRQVGPRVGVALDAVVEMFRDGLGKFWAELRLLLRPGQ